MNTVVRQNFPRVRSVIKNGETYWVCDSRSKKLRDGKIQWFATQANAIARHDEILSRLRTGTTLTDAEAALFIKYRTAYAQLPLLKDDKQVLSKIETVLENGLANAIKGNERKEEKPTLETLANLWVSAKERGDNGKVRPATLKEIRQTAKIITENWGQNRYATLKKQDIQTFINELETTHLTTKRNWKTRIGGFCSWCVDFGHAENRGNPAKGITIKVGTPERPKILSLDKVTKLITLCETIERFKPLVNMLTLGLFAGIRPQEIQRLTWSDIELESEPYDIERFKGVYGVINIKATVAKTGRPRAVIINETLWRFLVKYRNTPIFPDKNFRRLFDALRDHAGFGDDKSLTDIVLWSPDIIRHTSASYFVSRTQSWDLCASQFGNSTNVLMRFYVDTIHPKRIAEYYQIKPIDDGGGNVIKSE